MSEANRVKYKCVKDTAGARACGATDMSIETSKTVDEKLLLHPNNADLFNNNNFNVAACFLDGVFCHNPQHSGAEVSLAGRVYCPGHPAGLNAIVDYQVQKFHEGMVSTLVNPAGLEKVKEFNSRRVELEVLEVLKHVLH
jgi:hypothetical protein